jgi:hypothetical protein
VGNPKVIKNQLTQLYKMVRMASRENEPFSFVRRRKKCERKEKQEYKIGKNLSLEKRKRREA